MFSKVAIKVQNLSKCYQIYDEPVDRLKQFLLPRIWRAIGLKSRDYFRGFSALDNVSFELQKGDSVGIIGRNGSGKSTLLQIICGTLNPTSGVIQTNGRIAALLELGSGFNAEFTGRENIYMNAAILGLSKEEIDDSFDQIVAFADIGEFIEQPLKTYSSGMQMRLAFAVSVCVDPEILVIDEALAVGDMAFQQKCFVRLAELREAGVTILMVSHDIMLIRNYCNQGIYLDGGRVKFVGDAETAGEYYVRDMHAERQGAVSEWGSLGWNSDETRGKLSFGSSRGRILHSYIEGRQSKDQSFKQGELVVIEIIGEIDVDVMHPEFIFQLRDARGYVLYGIPTTLDKLKIIKGDRQNQIFARLELVLILGEGNYAASVGLNSRDGASVVMVLDKVVSIFEFNVVQDFDKKSHGCVDLGGNWKNYDSNSSADAK